MASIKWEYILAWGFALCSLIFILLMMLVSRVSEKADRQLFQDIENVQSAGFNLQALPILPLNEQTLDDYSELVERPLFFSERLPVIVSEEVAGSIKSTNKVAKDISLRLIGIVRIPNSVYALFQKTKAKPEENKFQRLKEGDEIEGWTLKEIKADRVVISSATKSKEISLTKPRVHKESRKTRHKKKKPKRPNPFNRKPKMTTT